ncbi:pilus assembly protein TadG-related protein [Trinickia acidisoli]|uniref:pilus assembly protein TadG-related protein n=1 Tax=Trinickia acidisoli TaxID=2767482 RepID=UPI001A8D40A5|nr:TadG family pilus assembly protein [Trinickia acidisoli]
MRNDAQLARRAGRQRGSIAIYVALLLPIAIGFIALAVDIGRALVVRNQLQNAADAAALAGAEQLQWTNTSTTWANATSKATAAVSLNAADGQTLSTGTVTAGYWNLTGSPSGMQSTTITPGTDDRPAIKVTVSRVAGSNGGPIQTYFAGLIGTKTINVSATAVAAITPPGTANPGALFPLAITQCMYNTYWNSTTGEPVIDPTTGKPYEFDIGSSYHYSSCLSGQWTTFNLNVNDTPAVENLIANGNPTSLSVGSDTWIEPGTKTAIYNAVNTPVEVLLPVVVDVSTNAAVPIVAFAPFEIDASVGGSGKYIQGHFVTNYVPTNVGPGTGTPPPYYGAYVPPVLVN